MTSVAFGSNTDQRFEVANSATIQDLDEFTILVWFKQDVQDAGNIIFRKGALKRLVVDNTSSDEFKFVVGRATTNASAVTANSFSTGVWTFLAAAYESTIGPRIYTGGLREIATEVTYGSQTAGSGAVSADSAELIALGGRENDTNGLGGDIAYVEYLASTLTLNQVRSRQFRSRVTDSTRALWNFGLHGVGSLVDYSGNRNNGTVTGSLGPVQGDGFPLDLMLVGTTMDTPFAVRDRIGHLDWMSRQNLRRSLESRDLLDRRRAQPLSVWS